MKNVIKFKGRLYHQLEEGAHTISGEIIEVVATPSQAVEPKVDEYKCSEHGIVKSDSNECPNCLAPAPQKCECPEVLNAKPGAVFDCIAVWPQPLHAKCGKPICPAPKAHADPCKYAYVKGGQVYGCKCGKCF